MIDEDGTFKSLCNMAMVGLEPVAGEEDIAEREYHHELEAHGQVDVLTDMTRHDAERLHLLISRHAHYTGSARAKHISDNWADYRPKFVKVMPVEYRRALREMEQARVGTAMAAE